jgi:hypothetical protein
MVTAPPLEAGARAEGEGEARWFVTCAGGRPLARAWASVPPELRDRDGEPVGTVGCLEATDARAAADVLERAVAWLAERGLRRAWAPMNGDIWHGYRAMTRGFDLEAYLGEPRTPPAHAEWLEAAGFAVRQRWHSFELEGRDALDELAGAHAEARRGLAALGCRVVTLEGMSFDEIATRLHALLDRSFSGFLGYTTVSATEFRGVLAPAGPALQRGASVFVVDAAGADAGFAVAFDDLASPIPRSLLHLGGLVPEARRKGVAGGVLGDVAARLRALDRPSVLVTLVAEGSPVRRLFGRFAEDRRREYALFERRP